MRFSRALALTLVPLALLAGAALLSLNAAVDAFSRQSQQQARQLDPLPLLDANLARLEDAFRAAYLGEDERTYRAEGKQVAVKLERLQGAYDEAGELNPIRRANRTLAIALAEGDTSLLQPLDRRPAKALNHFISQMGSIELNISGARVIALSESHSRFDRARQKQRVLILTILALTVLGLLLVFVIGRKLARDVLVPLRRIEEATGRIEEGDLGQRVGSTRPDELGGLGRAFDAMAANLERGQAELAASQERLLESTKMEAVGLLAGGVAHDFNNLLLVIGSYAEFLRQSFDADDPRNTDVDEISKAADRAATLTRQLLTFSRRDVTQPVVLDVNQSIGGMQEMLRRTLSARIDLRFDLEPDLCRSEIDPASLEQAILNLVLNAQNAMPAGGSLTIATRSAGSEEIASVDELSDGRYIAIAVSDTGEGMTEDVRDRALEPFFTTRAAGEGSGLGLPSVYGTVTGAGGALVLDSEVGAGTTITLYLPATLKQSPLARLPAPAPTDSGRSGEIVLVAEDEPTIRGLAERILSAHGYEVIVAASGAEALQAAAQVAHIDVLLTDVIMPGMTGSALSEELTALRPGVRTVFMSGYSDQIVAEHGVLDASTIYLQKPFQRVDLLSALESALSPPVLA